MNFNRDGYIGNKVELMLMSNIKCDENNDIETLEHLFHQFNNVTIPKNTRMHMQFFLAVLKFHMKNFEISQLISDKNILEQTYISLLNKKEYEKFYCFKLRDFFLKTKTIVLLM